MPSETVSCSFQEAVAYRLADRFQFGRNNVYVEWRSFQDNPESLADSTASTRQRVRNPMDRAFRFRELYGPRIDIAIGPLSIRPGNRTDEYSTMIDTHSSLINKLLQAFRDSVDTFNSQVVHELRPNFRLDIPDRPRVFNNAPYFNKNPRCFIAIEIEASKTRKYMIGDIVNAVALGRIGIIVTEDDARCRAFLRILVYLNFLYRAEKTAYNSQNVIIVTKKQLGDILDVNPTYL